MLISDEPPPDCFQEDQLIRTTTLVADEEKQKTANGRFPASEESFFFGKKCERPGWPTNDYQITIAQRLIDSN